MEFGCSLMPFKQKHAMSRKILPKMLKAWEVSAEVKGPIIETITKLKLDILASAICFLKHLQEEKFVQC